MINLYLLKMILENIKLWAVLISVRVALSGIKFAYILLSRVSLTIDKVWIGKWFHWTLTDRNYK
jgi:hypothetical protein